MKLQSQPATQRRSMLSAVGLAIALASCQGQIGGAVNGAPGGQTGPGSTGAGTTPGTGAGTGGTGGPGTCAAAAPAPGRSPLRRLNRAEYRNTLRDLFPTLTKVIDAAVATFPLHEEKLGFTNNADALTVTGFLAEQYMSSAETGAAEARKNLTTLLPCNHTTVGDDSCAQQFVDAFGTRALRRPLTSDESARYFAMYTNGKPDGFEQGVSLAITAILESPNFLYRREASVPTANADRKSTRLNSSHT